MSRLREAGARAATHVMPITKGVFALRYVACAKPAASRVIVAIDPDGQGKVELIYSPGARDGVLRNPGDLCVISANADAHVLVTTLGSDAAQPETVTLKLDRLDSEASALPAPEPKKPDPAAVATPVPLRIVGHVELDGDVSVSGGEWLGGQDGKSRIEGFALQWPRRPADVDISYGCSVRGLGRLPDVVIGEFAGTRQQARGISGVAFSLIGESARSYELTVEAEFSDGTRCGPETAPVDFRGPTGREELVGLALALTRLEAAQSTARRIPSRMSNMKPLSPPGRQVRVFRSPKQSS